MTDESQADAVMDALGDLPEHDVDEWRKERIRTRAHETLAREASPVARWLGRLEHVYARTLEPAVVFGLGTVYLAWAFTKVAQLIG